MPLNSLKCPDCERSFSTPQGLAIHRRRAHGDNNRASVPTGAKKTGAASLLRHFDAEAQDFIIKAGIRMYAVELKRTRGHIDKMLSVAESVMGGSE